MSTGKATHCTKHIPQRTCIGCRQTKQKRELVRVVRTIGGAIEIDEGGEKAGRGAYLCPDLSCWDLGLRKSRLGHALHCEIDREEHQQLIAYAMNLTSVGVPQKLA